jgi:hypothetical protein
MTDANRYPGFVPKPGYIPAEMMYVAVEYIERSELLCDAEEVLAISKWPLRV